MFKANHSIISFLHFSKDQRKGLLALFVIIIGLQITYCLIDFTPKRKSSLKEQQWLSVQKEVDALKSEQPKTVYKMHPFNPNFITDAKGYKLGMTVEQIDRLLAFRKQGKFANSPEEFQKVTGISDSLLNVMAPFFKFPDWVNKKTDGTFQYSNAKSNWKVYPKKEMAKVIDINLATKEDLMKVYGIGDAISDRILKQREILGAFVSMEQMNDVWGLSPEVIEKLNQGFKISMPPKPNKININNASIKELGQFPYFRYPISKNIVTYRSMNGDINTEDLSKIKAFPVDRIKIIALYLEF